MEAMKEALRLLEEQWHKEWAASGFRDDMCVNEPLVVMINKLRAILSGCGVV
ncbi:MAG: hypothetical protein SVV67_08765 [Bacillota bacterium]|nr:hypothetical protein [Bacillota bacterium]